MAATKKMTNFCSLCAEKHEATRQCLDCGVLMCLDISRLHCMLKENKDHRVATIQEAQEYLRAHPLPMVLMCPEHPDKAFEYFDESCQKLLCVSCAILGNHSGHKCKSIPEAARVGRNQFQQSIGNLNVKIAELQTQGNSTQGILRDFTVIAQSRRDEVDSVFDKLIDDLETRRASLHQQIDAMVEKKSSLLNNQYHSGETLKHTMEELRDRCGDWKAITNDSQCLMKLLESKKELTKVNQLFVSNRGSFSNLIPSVRPLIETYLPSTDDWKISLFGGVCDQKLSETSSILQRSSPDSALVLNGAVMKLKILLRDTNGSKYAYTSSVKPITVSWRVVNLEKNTVADLDIKKDVERYPDEEEEEEEEEEPEEFVRTIDGELEFSYTIPFFNHEIRCFVNGKELSESRLRIQLTSISEDMKCVFCQRANAVQAHALQSNATNQYGYGCYGRDDLYVQLEGSDTKYLGLCSQHVPWIENGQMSRSYQLNVDKTPQKCNLGQPRGRK